MEWDREEGQTGVQFQENSPDGNFGSVLKGAWGQGRSHPEERELEYLYSSAQQSLVED